MLLFILSDADIAIQLWAAVYIQNIGDIGLVGLLICILSQKDNYLS